MLLMNFCSDIWSLGCVLYELLTLKHAVSVFGIPLARCSKADSSIHVVNRYPLDNSTGFGSTAYPLDGDLSTG